MTEPDNHTVHLLREIRSDIQRLDQDIQRLDRKVDGIQIDLKQNLLSLTQSLAGEMAGRAYTVGGI